MKQDSDIADGMCPYRGRWRSVLGMILLSAVVLLLSGPGLRAAEVLMEADMDVRIRGTLGDGVNPIAFSGQTFAQVRSDVEAVVDATPAGQRPAATFMIGPDSWADVNVGAAHVELGTNQQGHSTLTVRGFTNDFLDRNAELVATARWTSSNDTDPDLHVFYKYLNIDFSTFEEFFGNFPIEFSESWLAMSRNEGVPRVVDPAHFPGVADYFDDGIAGTDDTFTVKNTFLPRLDHLEVQANAPSEGVTFRGVFDPEGMVADTVRELGLSGEARLDGDISYASVIKESCRPSADGGQTCGTGVSGRPAPSFGLSLTATFPLAGATETLPPFVRTAAGWQLKLAVDTAGSISAGFKGAMFLDVGDDVHTLDGGVTLAGNVLQNTIEATVTLRVTNVNLAENVRLKDITAEAKFIAISKKKGGSTTSKPPPSGLGASLSGTARLDLEPLTGSPGDVLIQLRLGFATGGGFEILVSAGTTGKSSTFDDLKQKSGFNAASDLQFALSNFGITVKLNFGGPGAAPATTTTVAGATTTTVAGATTTTTVAGRSGVKATVFINGTGEFTRSGKTTGMNTLVGLEFQFGGAGGATTTTVAGGGASRIPVPEVLVAMRPSSNNSNITATDLFGGTLEQDFTLPEFAISVATKTWQIRADELPASLKLATELTGSDIANQILFREGVNLKADITLDGPLGEALNNVGVDTTGKLRIEATLPLFGSSTWGFRVSTPTIKPQPKPGEELPAGFSNRSPFRGGQVSIVAGKDWVDVQSNRNKLVQQVGIIGNLDLAVLKAQDANCKVPEGVDPETHTFPDSCFDLLKLKVDGLFEKTSTTTSLNVAASLLVDSDGWQNPFGVEGLTIRHLAATAGVTIGHAGPVVTIGMSGSLEVNGRDFTLAFLLNAKPRPPYVEPQGFTFAIDRLGLDDLVGLYNLLSKERDIDPARVDLPNVRLENVYVAFGVIDNPRLCIRMGFFRVRLPWRDRLLSRSPWSRS